MSISDVKPKVRILLFAKSAGRCEFDDCNKILYEDDLTKFSLNFSEVAHIIADKPDGPRGDNNKSSDKDYCNNINNLMMLCKDHHHLVDQHSEIYTADVLRAMKQRHEKRIQTVTGMTPDRTSNIVFYKARTGGFPVSIDYRDAIDAISSEGFYPASSYPIDLSMVGNLKEDDDKSYWTIQLENLESQFNKQITPLIENDKNHNHFSLFAFAPIPLLIRLGLLFSDKCNVDIYQLKKDPTYWKWETISPDYNISVVKPEKNHNTVALNLSLSAHINNKRIFASLGTNEVSIWEMDIDGIGFPKNDRLRTIEQLIEFKREFRRLLDDIKYLHGQDSEIHIFPATSIAYSIEIGRVWQEKADLPLNIYDQNKKTGGFTKIFRVE